MLKSKPREHHVEAVELQRGRLNQITFWRPTSRLEFSNFVKVRKLHVPQKICLSVSYGYILTFILPLLVI